MPESADDAVISLLIKLISVIASIAALLISAFFGWRNNNRAGDDRLNSLDMRLGKLETRTETKFEALQAGITGIQEILRDMNAKLWGNQGQNQQPRKRDSSGQSGD